MALPLETGQIQDEWARRAIEQLALHFPLHPVDLANEFPILAVLAATRTRFSWGKITAAGARAAGSIDYTVANLAAGQYRVTWTPAKAGVNYAVLATPTNVGGADTMHAAAIVAASFDVFTFVANTLAVNNTDWSFLVIDAQ